MKTHTARWRKTAPHTWIIKARARDGGAVLATVRTAGRVYAWQTGTATGTCETFYAAQRAARAALRGVKQ